MTGGLKKNNVGRAYGPVRSLRLCRGSRHTRPCSVSRSRNVHVRQLADKGGGKYKQYNLYHTNHT